MAVSRSPSAASLGTHVRHHRHHPGQHRRRPRSDRRRWRSCWRGSAGSSTAGYDSAGIALVGPQASDGLWRARAANGTRSLDDLTKRAEDAPRGSGAGIGHTRWATHGGPTEGNAHPHVDCTARLALVHNGIIENHVELTDELVAAGHHLESETDTEVLAHLIEVALDEQPALGLAAAVRMALGRVQGAFSLAVVRSDEPDLIVAARRVSPLLMGISGDAAFLASDIPAILGLTRDFFVLEDDQVAELRPGTLRVTDLAGAEVVPQTITVDWDLDAARKDGYDDYMSKEMHEQPKAVADTLLDRLLPDGTLVPRRGAHHQRRAAGGQQGLHRGLREQLPRRPHGQVRH